MSYSEPPPPPPQYGAPIPPQGGVPPKKSGMAVASLVLGILAVIPCFWSCMIFGVLAVVFGQLGKSDIAKSGGAKTGAGMAKWGFILGIIGLALGVLAWILSLTGVLDFNYEYSTS